MYVFQIVVRLFDIRVELHGKHDIICLKQIQILDL